MAEILEVSAKLYSDIYRFVRRRTRNSVAAEDLTQQVFAEAAASETWRSGRGTRGFLYTIASRRSVDELRRPERGEVPLADATHLPSNSGEDARHSRAAISDAIDRLDPDQRAVVILKLLRGLPFSEVAHVVGASEAACKMRLRRALVTLRRELEEKGICP
jgi:RNA polymerase sigma-70 factor (ECF subfamily)